MNQTGKLATDRLANDSRPERARTTPHTNRWRRKAAGALSLIAAATLMVTGCAREGATTPDTASSSAALAPEGAGSGAGSGGGSERDEASANAHTIDDQSAEAGMELTPEAQADALTANAAQAVRQFTANLHRALDGLGEADGNLVYSPVSTHVALSMVSAGARGDTLTQLRTVLGQLPVGEQSHAAELGLSSHIASLATGDNILRMANRVWVSEQRRGEVVAATEQVLRGYYGSELAGADFAGATEQARSTINGWVSDRTEALIPELIAQGVLTPNTVMVLVNAIYFRFLWAEPFEASATSDRAFRLADGSEARVPTMEATRSGVATRRGPGWRSVDLPYADRRVVMSVVLPDEDAGGLDQLAAQLVDGSLLASLATPARGQRVHLRVPRMTLRSQLSLGPALEAAGMPLVFSEHADLSGLMTTRNISLSHVIHEAFIQVDEVGTEAAAATAAVVAVRSAAPGQEPMRFFVDRPFLVVVRDVEHSVPLFVAFVADPRSSD